MCIVHHCILVILGEGGGAAHVLCICILVVLEMRRMYVYMHFEDSGVVVHACVHL